MKTLREIRKEQYGKDYEWSNDVIPLKKWLNLKKEEIKKDEDLDDSTLGDGLTYLIDELLKEIEESE